MEKIAYFDSSHEMPEEIVRAAGFLPYKILGDIHTLNDPADKYLSNFFCPAARSWLTEALSSSKNWAGIVVAQGCNTTNRHFDVWKMHVETPFLYFFSNPILDNDTAKKYYKVELKRLISSLEKQFKVDIPAEKLQASIKESNEMKKRLRELSALRSVKDIANRRYLEIIIRCLQPPGEGLLQELDAELREWKEAPDFPADKKRFLLTGSDVTYAEWMDTLEECDIRVVRDDLSLGERYFANLIPEMEDPLDALIEYYINIPKPATRPTIQKRIDYLLKSLEETAVDGIISQTLKFCEPYAYDSVTVNNALKEKGHKLIYLEREYTPVKDQQLITRLMAFTEML